MAFHNHYHHHHLQNNHQTTTATTSCCCQPPSCHHPPPPPPSIAADPYLVTAIVSQLLQIPLNFYSHPINPTSSHHNQRHPLPQNDPFQFQQSHSILSSLLQRIDALDASLHRFSSSFSSTFSLRDAAARTIQTHFRAYLVRRSRTLRQLKDLASVKSSVTLLKSSLSRHGFVDFDSLSRKATDLLLRIDSIQSGDQMIRDSKRSITREIVELLEMVDGVCVKRHQVLAKTMKNVRLVRNDNNNNNNNNNRTVRDGRGSSGYGVGLKSRNVGSDEKKLIANLKERVERIGRMSRALEEEEVSNVEHEGVECGDDGDYDITGQSNNNCRLQTGGSGKRNSLRSNGKKRVCFVEDGNTVRAYDLDGEIRNISRDIEEIEYCSKGRQEDEEAQSDGEQSLGSSEEEKHHLSNEVSQSHGDQEEEEFTFSAAEPVKMGLRADSMLRKPGVKIIG